MKIINDNVVPQLLSNVRVDCRQRVVEQYDVRIGVDSACERDSCLLATGEIYPFPAYFRFVPSGQQVKVRL